MSEEYSLVSNIAKAISRESSWPICLYEGKDDIFYSHFFSEPIKKKHHSIVCNGKTNVLNVLILLKRNKRLSQYKIVSFVDHDYDGKPSKRRDSMYMTPCYAIENFYCSEEAFERFAQAELDIQKCINLDELQYLKEKYYNTFINNLKKISELNSWAYYQRKKGKNYTTASLSNINLNKVLSTEDIWKYLKELFPESIELSDADKQRLARNSMHNNPVNMYRGKWVFELYKQQIGLIIENAKNLLKDKKIKAKPEIIGASISSLANYVPLDETLKEFLEKNGLR
ncbi:MAG: DUF4435 domain-containing protein [Fibrobacter sp.]|nr:DUF4435 domain-containing protein [Fibrobacter sp.]